MVPDSPVDRPASGKARRRLSALFGIPALVMLLAFALAIGASVCMGRRMVAVQQAFTQRNTDRYQRGVRAQQRYDLQVRELNAQFEAGEIAAPEWEKTVRKLQTELSREVTEPPPPLALPHYPASLQILVAITLMFAPPVLVVIALFAIATAIAGGRLRSGLRNKGYVWPTLGDSMWLLLVLRTRVRAIPLATDFHSLPDTREDVDSLVEVVRLRWAVTGGRA